MTCVVTEVAITSGELATWVAVGEWVTAFVAVAVGKVVHVGVGARRVAVFVGVDVALRVGVP
jgi:hypothetical protein